MKAELIQAEIRTNPDDVAEAFRHVLVDRGYAVTHERVKEAIVRWTEGQPPSGIIDMFVHKWIKNGTD